MKKYLVPLLALFLFAPMVYGAPTLYQTLKDSLGYFPEFNVRKAAYEVAYPGETYVGSRAQNSKYNQVLSQALGSGGVRLDNRSLTQANTFTADQTFSGIVTINNLLGTQASTSYLAVSTLASTSVLRVSNLTTLGNQTDYPQKATSTIPHAVPSAFAIGTTTTTMTPALTVDTYFNRVGIGTTSPQSTFAVMGSSTATTTLEAAPAPGSANGTCLQLYSPTTLRPFRMYATSTGPAWIEAGSCQTR